LWTIIEHLRKFRRCKRGVSNVIVIVLSLVILVVVSSNVILWSYQMNQLDWEKMQETLTIVNVAPNKEIRSFYPSGYVLGGSTSWMSGGTSDLVADDGAYMVFRSYLSRTDPSDEYTTEVEFVGSGNTENWSQLNWTVDSAWTIGSVNVTVQLYNYTFDGYSTGGNGYIAYISDNTPNTDKNISQTVNVNPTHFRNTTGYWKMKIKGVKATATQFDFKVDLIEFKAVKNDGTLFTFKNQGSSTFHLVSLWVNNPTHHQRYDIDVFANSGETISYINNDVSLPDKPYTVKVVTERGNTAVYSES